MLNTNHIKKGEILMALIQGIHHVALDCCIGPVGEEIEFFREA